MGRRERGCMRRDVSRPREMGRRARRSMLPPITSWMFAMYFCEGAGVGVGEEEGVALGVPLAEMVEEGVSVGVTDGVAVAVALGVVEGVGVEVCVEVIVELSELRAGGEGMGGTVILAVAEPVVDAVAVEVPAPEALPVAVALEEGQALLVPELLKELSRVALEVLAALRVADAESVPRSALVPVAPLSGDSVEGMDALGVRDAVAVKDPVTVPLLQPLLEARAEPVAVPLLQPLLEVRAEPVAVTQLLLLTPPDTDGEELRDEPLELVAMERAV